MGKFDADAMRENLSELFSENYVNVERDGQNVIVDCAELGTTKCRMHIEESFDDSGGVVKGMLDKFIGADVVVYEDFDIEANESENTLRLTPK